MIAHEGGTIPHHGYAHAVFIEDDLILSSDAVHYFHTLSRVMDVDDTIYCISAHIDNGFYATSQNYVQGE